jgi:rhodanese-related sulfurtransferase
MRRISALLSLILLLVGIAACSGPASSHGDVTIGPDTVILDVRTAPEFAEGHLEGARLIDFNAGELTAAIPELDADAAYVVYCRSGNRSAKAAAQLTQAGFTNVTDLGSLDDAATATGLPIVR